MRKSLFHAIPELPCPRQNEHRRSTRAPGIWTSGAMMGENLLLGQKLALQQRRQRAFSPRGGVVGGLAASVKAVVTEAATLGGVSARAGLARLFAAVLAGVFAWPVVAAAGDEPFARRYEQRGDFQREAPPRDLQPRDSRFAGDSWGPRREAAGYQPSGDAPEGGRPYRFSSEERRQLRRDLHEAGRDLYAPRR